MATHTCSSYLCGQHLQLTPFVSIVTGGFKFHIATGSCMHVYSVSYTAGSWRTTLQCKLLSMYTDDSKDQSGGTQPGLA